MGIICFSVLEGLVREFGKAFPMEIRHGGEK